MKNKYNIDDQVFAFTPSGIFRTKITGILKHRCSDFSYLIADADCGTWYPESYLLPNLISLDQYCKAAIDNFYSGDIEDDHNLTPEEIISGAMNTIEEWKPMPKYHLGQKVFVYDGADIYYQAIRKIEPNHYVTGYNYNYTLMDGQSWLEKELFGSEKELKDYFYSRINELVREDKLKD